jgi:hypothetical protein
MMWANCDLLRVWASRAQYPDHKQWGMHEVALNGSDELPARGLNGPVCTENSDSDVLVMKPSEYRT